MLAECFDPAKNQRKSIGRIKFYRANENIKGHPIEFLCFWKQKKICLARDSNPRTRKRFYTNLHLE